MVRVRYFAAARDAAGCDEEHLQAATLAELTRTMVTQHPALGALLDRCAVLVNGTRIADDAGVPADATVDVLPPFAGG